VSDIAIRIENLGKQYRLGESKPYLTFRESLCNLAAAPFRRFAGRNGNAAAGDPLSPSPPRPLAPSPPADRPPDDPDTIWALRDVSLEVPRGEVLGIIGRNGAGKSTLLKILSRITEPTTGRVEIHGRVGCLLEVGTGFHPELTGRENIFVNGAILGMTRREIKCKFDEIVDFAGVEKFIDTPVKRYSSGMSVRLAFAVAAHLDPEILVVDEVLAVGDAEFQKRCLGKMGEVARGGRTVLFVSHNMAAVESLCAWAILLCEGSIELSGSAEDVTGEYLKPTSGADGSGLGVYQPKSTSSLIRKVRLVDEHGAATDRVRTGRNVSFEVDLQSLEPLTGLTFRIVLTTESGVRVCNCNSRIETGRLFAVERFVTIRCCLREQRLAPGRYAVSVGVFFHGRQLDCAEPAFLFEVCPADLFGTGLLPSREKAVYLPNAEWSMHEKSGSARGRVTDPPE